MSSWNLTFTPVTVDGLMVTGTLGAHSAVKVSVTTGPLHGEFFTLRTTEGVDGIPADWEPSVHIYRGDQFTDWVGVSRSGELLPALEKVVTIANRLARERLIRETLNIYVEPLMTAALDMRNALNGHQGYDRREAWKHLQDMAMEVATLPTPDFLDSEE